MTPDIDDCRPRCLNIARTDRDIAKIRARRRELQEVVNDTLTPDQAPTRTARTAPPQRDFGEAPVKRPEQENDPIRRQIIAAMDRLLAGQPLRSSGRLSISQLAVEADVGRWHLTHQHVDLKELFQAGVRNSDGAPAAFARWLSDHETLKTDHAKLLAHCAELEERLQLYATVINVLSLEQQSRERGAKVAKINGRRRSS